LTLRDDKLSSLLRLRPILKEIFFIYYYLYFMFIYFFNSVWAVFHERREVVVGVRTAVCDGYPRSRGGERLQSCWENDRLKASQWNYNEVSKTKQKVECRGWGKNSEAKYAMTSLVFEQRNRLLLTYFNPTSFFVSFVLIDNNYYPKINCKWK